MAAPWGRLHLVQLSAPLPIALSSRAPCAGTLSVPRSRERSTHSPNLGLLLPRFRELESRRLGELLCALNGQDNRLWRNEDVLDSRRARPEPTKRISGPSTPMSLTVSTPPLGRCRYQNGIFIGSWSRSPVELAHRSHGAFRLPPLSPRRAAYFVPDFVPGPTRSEDISGNLKRLNHAEPT